MSEFQDDPRYPWFDGTLTGQTVGMLRVVVRENFNVIESQEMMKKEHELRQWKYDYSFLKEKKVNDASSIVSIVWCRNSEAFRSIGYG